MVSKLLNCLAFVVACCSAASQLELFVVDRSESSFTISWRYDASVYGVPAHYELAVSDISLEFLPTTERVYTVRPVLPCHNYSLSLSAVFPTTTLKSDTKVVTTLSGAPGPVNSLRVEKGLLTWLAPTNGDCVTAYRVCANARGAEPNCAVVPKAPVDLSKYEGCSSVIFQVSAETQDKKTGNSVWLESITPFKEPSNPENLKITPSIHNTTAQLDWEIPHNHACVKSIMITYGPKLQPAEIKTIVFKDSLLQKSQTMTISNFHQCADVDFSIGHTSIKDSVAEPIQGTLTSEDIRPGEMDGMKVVENLKENSVSITWNPTFLARCVGRVNVCLINELTKKKTCKDQEDPINSPSLTFGGVEACGKYSAVAKAYSTHSKYESPSRTVKFDASELAPGPISNLKVQRDADSDNSLRATFDAPTINSACVVGYMVSATEVDHMLEEPLNFVQVQGNQAVLDHLKDCSPYKINVTPFTASQKLGPTVTSETVSTGGRPASVTGQREAQTGWDYTYLEFFIDRSMLCADEYVVSYEDKNKTFPAQTDRLMSVKIGNLEECHRYNLTVQASCQQKLSEPRFVSTKTWCH